MMPTDPFVFYPGPLEAASPDALMAQAADHAGQGRWREAALLCGRVLQSHSGRADAWHGLGMVSLHAGKPQDAVRLLTTALALDPALAQAHIHLGVALSGCGLLDEGIVACRRATVLAPGDAGAWHNLGVALHRAGQPAAAVAALECAIDRAPLATADPLCSLAEVLAETGHTEAAVARYFEAAAVAPHDPRPWIRLGALFQRRGEPERAVIAWRQSMQRAPAPAETHNNLGAALLEMGRTDEAETAFRQATTLFPMQADAWLNLGAVARHRRSAEAAGHYRQALAVGGGNPAIAAAALDGLTWELRRQASWNDLPALEARLAGLIQDGIAAGQPPGLSPGFLLSLPLPARTRRALAEHQARRHAAPAVPRPSARPRTTGEPLRIAYLSADFGDHPIGHLIAGLFARHDRAAVQVSAYAWGGDDVNPWRRRIAAGCDRFIDVGGESDEALARRIAADGIDILVDLMGYTRNSRPGVPARRPAPIQVSWLGYADTMGTSSIDYILADRTVLPPACRDEVSEAPVWLPHSFMVTDRDRPPAAQPPSRAAAGLPERGLVFAGFGRAFKLTPSLFGLWMRLLKAVPDSVLWLTDNGPEVTINLRAAARSHGIAPERLVFAGRVADNDAYLARLGLADLCLDTLPYNGHSTVVDILWAGVPLVTCPGDSVAARVAASLLHAIGLPELVAPDLAGYERLALSLATDPAALAAVRARLAVNRRSTPLFDTDRFARHLEDAYALMWQRHCRGLPPDALSVPERPASGETHR